MMEQRKHAKRIEIKGARMGDTIFAHSLVGTINITKLAAAIAEARIWAPIRRIDWDPVSIGRMLGNRDIDPDRVRELEADADELHRPMIATILKQDGHGLILDGNHRVYVFWKRDIFHAEAHMVRSMDLPAFRVRTFIDGVELIDTDASIRKDFEFPAVMEPKP